MRLSRRRLNRTLLLRQHLLERRAAAPEDEVAHLVGLQAQESLSPYLALHARLSDLDPYAVADALLERRLVRLLTLRGTIHLLTPADALELRPWTQPVIERGARSSPVLRPVRDLDRETFDAALAEVLGDGPLAQAALGDRLAEQLPAAPAAALGQLARAAAPLVQLPPRGCWKQSGGVVYEPVDRWLGRPLTAPDVPGIVRRYLRAFGPASAADVTAWSGVTRLGPVLTGMADLVRHEDEDGKVLHDLPDAPLAEEDTPAPVRLLGCYDNLWLSHAARDRVTDASSRARWMGANGGTACTVFADGHLAGLWRADAGRVQVVELLRPFSRVERSGLEEEVARVEALLAR